MFGKGSRAGSIRGRTDSGPILLHWEVIFPVTRNQEEAIFFAEDSNVRHKFERALSSFIEEVKRDDNITAALLFGSLAKGIVWRKSDIDLVLIAKDERTPYKEYWLMDCSGERNGVRMQVKHNDWSIAQWHPFHTNYVFNSKWLFCINRISGFLV